MSIVSYSNLSRADLSGANLKVADLSYCDLTSACLDGADLTYCEMTGANLDGVSMKGAIKADLRGAMSVPDIYLEEFAELLSAYHDVWPVQYPTSMSCPKCGTNLDEIVDRNAEGTVVKTFHCYKCRLI